jgi:hypothetical protein
MSSQTVMDQHSEHGETTPPPAPSQFSRSLHWAGDRVRRHPVVVAAAALIVLHLVVRGGWTYRSWWYADDFVMISRSMNTDLSWSFLFQEYIDHLMPGDFLVSWVLAHAAPWEWWLAATVLVGCQAAIDVALYRLLTLLFGPRPLVLLPLSVYLFSAVTVGPSLWFAAALEWLPMQLALILALIGTVKYIRTGKFRHAVFTAGAVVFGLFFIEKAVLLIPLVGFYLLLFGASGGLTRRWAEMVRRYRPMLALLIVVGAGYLSIYFALVIPEGRPVESVGDVARLAKAMILDAFVPLTVGGPWHWATTAPPVSLPDTPGYAKWLTWQFALLVVVGTCWVRRGAWRAWAVLGACLAMDVALVAYARFGALKEVLGLDTRYTAESAVVVAVCLGLAIMRTVDEPRGATESGRAGVAALRTWLDARRVAVGVACALVVNVLVLNGIYSGGAYADIWAANGAKPWLTALRHDLGRTERPVEMMDLVVPANVVPPLLEDGRKLSEVLTGLPRQPRFVDQAEVLVTPGEDGHLYRSEVDGISAKTGPVPDCGWFLDQSGTVELRRHVFDWDWIVEIGYLAEADTTAVVEFGKTSRVVALRRGLNTVYLQAAGAGSTIRFSGMTPGTAVCVGNAAVGNPKPVERLVP